MSVKTAKSRTPGRKLHWTEAKARVGGTRKTRADLEQELEAYRREIAHARELLAEAAMQQAATSEMLRLISNSPIQSVLDAVAENAARLCDANNAEIFRLEDNLLRLAASYGEIPVVIHAYQGVPVNRETVTGRAACDGRTIHVHDLAAEEGEYPVGSSNAKREGHRTTLATPLLRDGTPIGIILVRRREIRPFSDKQIALLETFADQAAIALENVRLFEAEKRRTLALARANRDLAEREAKIRRLVDSNIIGIFIWDFDGRVLEANDEFLRMVNYDREDLISGRIRWTDLTPPNWRERDNAKIEQQKISGRLEPFEKEYTRKDGRPVPVLIGVATFEPGGNEGVAFVVDLTERKRAEQALMRSEAYLAQAQKLTHTGSWAWDPRTEEVLYCSAEMFQIFGLDPQESSPSRENFRQRIHPEDRDRIKEKFEEALREKVDTFAEYRVLLRDGTVRHINASGHLILNENGELIEFVGTATDVTERKRAEDAVRESELKHREIIETMPSMLWSTAPDGEPTHLNRRVLDYSGLRFEDFLRLGWKEFLHPDDFPETERAFNHAIQTGEPYEAVHRLRRTDGQYRWHHARAEPLRDKEQRIIQWYGLSVDIDERKKAEDRLRRSEAYLAEAERLSHSGSAAYNRSEILYYSEGAYRMFGFDPLQGTPSREAVWQRIHPDDRDGTNQTIERAVRERRSFTHEFRIILPDGTIRHQEAINHPIFSAGGELIEIVSTGIDVTERKRAGDALRESEAKFRDYAETASDWFWETGPDFRFTLLTENAFGSDPAQRIGTTCWDHALDVETEPSKWRLVWATLAAHRSFRDFVYCTIDGNGTPIYVKASGKPVFDGSGKFLGYRGTGTDVTAIVRGQRAEASLQSVQAELAHVSRVMTLGQLTASIAHEVNQPIGSARNNARAALNFLDRSPPDLGEVREALGCIVADADRAGGIIDRIRDQIKKVPPRSDRFDLNRAIVEVIGLAQSMITENGVSVQSRLASGRCPFMGIVFNFNKSF